MASFKHTSVFEVIIISLKSWHFYPGTRELLPLLSQPPFSLATNIFIFYKYKLYCTINVVLSLKCIVYFKVTKQTSKWAGLSRANYIGIHMFFFIETLRFSFNINQIITHVVLIWCMYVKCSEGQNELRGGGTCFSSCGQK